MKQQDEVRPGSATSLSGRWKWMFVLAHGLSQSIVLAVVQNFALLFGGFFLQLDLTATDVGLLLNCNAAVGPIFALAGGRLLCVLGHRKMAALGCSLLALGVVCSGQATTFQHLLFFYGFVSSVGAGLLLCSTGAAVNAAFGGGRRSKALVAAAAGAGVAPVAAPLLLWGLLQRYGLPGAALLCAGACLHCLAVAALLRPAVLPPPGKLSSKEGGKNKNAEPTIRRGTIVPVMKIDAPEEEVKQGGSRRSSGMSTGPQRRGTPGWSARQSVGSIYTGSSSRIYDTRSFQMSGDDLSRRSSRSSRSSLLPPAMAGQESSRDAHSKSLDVPGSGQKGERRGSTLSAGSLRWTQRLSVGSVHSTASILAVVVDEDEEEGRPHNKDLTQRRPTEASVVSSSLEVPGEQAEGRRRSSTASSHSGRGRHVGWWGRLSTGSTASSQSEISQRDGSANSSSLQIPAGVSLEDRRQSEDSKLGTRLRGGSFGKLDLPKQHERTRQMSVSSVRSAASSMVGYMTAAQSLRSSGSQGSGLWWSTLSLASTRLAEHETEEQPPPPTETTRLLDDGDEDHATPETPPEQRRDSRVSVPTTASSAAEDTTVTPDRGSHSNLLILIDPGQHSPSDPSAKNSITPEVTDDIGEGSKFPFTHPELQFPSEAPIKNSITLEVTDDIGASSSLVPIYQTPQFLEDTPVKHSMTQNDAFHLGNSGKDEKLLPVERQLAIPEKMLATPEDTSDLGSSDGEDDEDQPGVVVPKSKPVDAEEEKGISNGSEVPFNTMGTPLVSVAPAESNDPQGDIMINTEYSAGAKNNGSDTSRKRDSLVAGEANAESRAENQLEENNSTISSQPASEALHIGKENTGFEIDRRENLLDDKQELGSVSSSSAPTDKTIAVHDELGYSADDETVVDVDGEPYSTDKHELLGNSVETSIPVGIEEKSPLLSENKTTDPKQSGNSRPSTNNFRKPSQRYSIIISAMEGAPESGGGAQGYSLDLSSLRSWPRACLMLGLAVAHCADVNHALFTPLLLHDCGDVPLAMCALAAADLFTRLLVPVLLDGFHPPRKLVCVAGLLLLVVSRTVLTMFTQFGAVLLACFFVGASRGVKEVYLQTVVPSDDIWSTFCLQMVSQGVVFIVLGPFVGYIKDWSGDYGSSIVAINVATIVAVLLCFAENIYPAK